MTGRFNLPPVPEGAIAVIVTGQETLVVPRPGWTIGAVTTEARYALGYGSVPSDNWEIRDERGVLLDPAARPGNLRRLFVNRLAGIGA